MDSENHKVVIPIIGSHSEIFLISTKKNEEFV